MSARLLVRTYLDGKGPGLARYAVSEFLQGLFGWMPSLVGIGLRAVVYRAFLRSAGLVAIEDHVRIHAPAHIRLGRAVYLDHGVYLHGGPGGLSIGDGSWIMSGCRLHVFNFRGLPHAGIHLGRRTFVGEGSVMRGQGGITVGDHVLFGPGVQVLAVNHVFTDPVRPIMEQGITAEGISIGDGAWIGAGATLLDGVAIGKGACIGAGAVVTTSVPAHSLAVGVPARVVRNLIDDPLPAPTAPVHFGGLEDL